MRPRVVVSQTYPPVTAPPPPSKALRRVIWTLCAIIGMIFWVSLVAATELGLAVIAGFRP